MGLRNLHKFHSAAGGGIIDNWACIYLEIPAHGIYACRKGYSPDDRCGTGLKCECRGYVNYRGGMRVTAPMRGIRIEDKPYEVAGKWITIKEATMQCEKVIHGVRCKNRAVYVVETRTGKKKHLCQKHGKRLLKEIGRLKS